MQDKEQSDFTYDLCVFWLLGMLLMYALVKIAGIPLFAIFALLKACGVIDWHWAIVCIPIILWTLGTILELIAQATDK